jgi:Dyp-type peroxidase family
MVEALAPTIDDEDVTTSAPPIKTAPTAEDLKDIQGLVYSGWGDHKHAGYLFATIHEDDRSRLAARRWLADIAREVSSADVSRKAPGPRLNLALSPTGLAKLGVPAETLAALPQEAKRGMHQRARILGDDPPDQWEMGRDNELDVLLMVFARKEDELATLLQHHGDAMGAFATVRPPEVSQHLEGREHFGFADGVSQPRLVKPPRAHSTAADDQPAPNALEEPIATGEILLGYKNAYGMLPASPKLPDRNGKLFDLGANGSYLVFRKLHQHVERFWSYVHNRARELEPNDPAAAREMTELLGAKLVGRWKSGAPLALSPDRDDPKYATPGKINSFAYHDIDPDGDRCPISSHVRRANPRDARGDNPKESNDVVSRHRILRRGRSYGKPLAEADALAGHDDGLPRGLYFICLQSSIARGFEFIQQTWLSNPGFNGLFKEPDPIMGNGDGDTSVTIPMCPVRLRLPNVPIMVTVKGGGYFLLPSLTALGRIATG